MVLPVLVKQWHVSRGSTSLCGLKPPLRHGDSWNSDTVIHILLASIARGKGQGGLATVLAPLLHASALSECAVPFFLFFVGSSLLCTRMPAASPGTSGYRRVPCRAHARRGRSRAGLLPRANPAPGVSGRAGGPQWCYSHRQCHSHRQDRHRHRGHRGI